jgi:hypothetical protein
VLVDAIPPPATLLTARPLLIALAGAVLFWALSSTAHAAGTTASCVVNPLTHNFKITIQSAGKDAQAQADVEAVRAECQRASNGSARFRQAVKNIGNFGINVARTGAIQYGNEGPTTGRDGAGKVVNIDVGDHERGWATLTGGDQANRDAVRATTLLATIIHEVIGEELPGHDHIAINNAVSDALLQLGTNVEQLGECKGTGTKNVFNWAVTKNPSDPRVLVTENVTTVNPGGSRLEGCPAPVGGVAEAPHIDEPGAETASSPAPGAGALAAIAAGVAAGAVALLGVVRYASRPRRGR